MSSGYGGNGLGKNLLAMRSNNLAGGRSPTHGLPGMRDSIGQRPMQMAMTYPENPPTWNDWGQPGTGGPGSIKPGPGVPPVDPAFGSFGGGQRTQNRSVTGPPNQRLKITNPELYQARMQDYIARMRDSRSQDRLSGLDSTLGSPLPVWGGGGQQVPLPQFNPRVTY